LLASCQEDEIEVQKAAAPINRVVNAVAHAEMQVDRRELAWREAAGDFGRQARQKPLNRVMSLHGG